MLDEWALDYNHRRPHSSLDWQTPAAFAATLNDPAAGVVSVCLLTLRSGLRFSLRLSKRTNTTRFSHNDWYKKRGKVIRHGQYLSLPTHR